MSNLATPVFRVSFPSVFQANSFQGQAAKYKITMLFDVADIQGNPKQLELWNKMKAAVGTCAIEKWGSKEKIPKNFRNPFRNGIDKDFDGYGEGIIFINANRPEKNGKPGVVDQDVNPIIDPGEFYAGCYAQATVSVFAYNTAGNNGVAFGLNNVQKVRDGDAFSGMSKAEDDFDAIAGEPTVALDDSVNTSVETDIFG